MAFLISIDKTAEDGACAEYEYEDHGKRGRLRIEKQTGRVIVLLSAGPNIDKRAAWKLLQHREKGDYPDHALWAS